MSKIPETALEALAAFEAGSLTPESYLRALLERCAEVEPQLRAWAYLDPEVALTRLAGASGQGALAGLPIGVKDIIHALGMPRGCGSPIYAGAASPADAAVVAQRPWFRIRMSQKSQSTGLKVILTFVWPTICVRHNRNGRLSLQKVLEVISASRISKLQ